MSRNKDKGSAAERAIVDYLRRVGFIHAERRLAGATKDRGDIAGIPGVVIEVKNQATLKLAEWLEEAHLERHNDNAQIAAVWHKRRMKGSPAEWYVTMDGTTFAYLLLHFAGLDGLLLAEARDRDEAVAR
ncbi:hypothetical protein E1286_24155 [Nonomuraea terrae]|uniref:Uncharacterized protein n=1 Tax=Nonomuraea terrae TaxID=2530383 RepID=A0A4R4YMG9_9ACTN|nr:hypothetical protein [Nonomuraea terrae]TDD45414.1 hypothetical protein E1286_24155 [Nonomuraea terrae]